MTLLLDQEAETVARDEELLQNKNKDMLEARISATNAAVWPAKSGDVPDMGAKVSDRLPAPEPDDTDPSRSDRPRRKMPQAIPQETPASGPIPPGPVPPGPTPPGPVLVSFHQHQRGRTVVCRRFIKKGGHGEHLGTRKQPTEILNHDPEES